MTIQRLKVYLFYGCEITKQQLYALVYSLVQSLGPDPQLGQLGRGLCGWQDVKRWHSSSPLKIFRSHSKVKRQEAYKVLQMSITNRPPHEDESIKGALWSSIQASFQAQCL